MSENNRVLDLESMRSMSIDQIVGLYKNGYVLGGSHQEESRQLANLQVPPDCTSSIIVTALLAGWIGSVLAKHFSKPTK